MIKLEFLAEPIEVQTKTVRQLFIDLQSGTVVIHGRVNEIYNVTTEPIPFIIGDDYEQMFEDYLLTLAA